MCPGGVAELASPGILAEEPAQNRLRQRSVEIIGNANLASIQAERASLCLGNERYQSSHGHTSIGDCNLLTISDPLQQSRKLRLCLVNVHFHVLIVSDAMNLVNRLSLVVKTGTDVLLSYF